MLEQSFVKDSPEMITPEMTIGKKEKELAAQYPFRTFILIFSKRLYQELLARKWTEVLHPSLQIGAASYKNPICRIKDSEIGLALCGVGASTAVAVIEELRVLFPAENFIVFGSCGVLSEVKEGGFIVPEEAYRDEGTSFHYAPPSDWIQLSNAKKLQHMMDEMNVDWTGGKTWTTDAFYRETKEEVDRHRNEGCVCVDMEASALQAVCDFRDRQLYLFLYSADLLQGSWQRRILGSLETDSGILSFQLAQKIAKQI